MKKTINKKSLLYLSIFGIGVTIGDIVEWGFFELDKSISIIDALTLFVTFGVTWYIATVIDKQSKNKQIESDLVIEQIREIETIIKELNISTEPIPLFEVNLAVHKISLVKNIIFKNISNEDLENEFKSGFKNVKDLLTNRPIDKNDKSQITISKNMVNYSEVRVKEIITELYSFKAVIFKLKMEVGRID